MIQGAVTTEPLLLTYSESKQWLRDRRQWYLGTYRGLHKRGPDAFGGAFSVGNGYHDALAAYYDDGTDPVAFLEAAQDVKLMEWPEHEEDIQKETDLLRPMVAGYIEWLADTGADADLEITGSERMVSVELAPAATDRERVEGKTYTLPPVRLLSKLDAPCQRAGDGFIGALEHKTTGDLNWLAPLMKVDRQFLSEHLARFLELQVEGMSTDEAMARCHGILVNQAKKNKRTARAKPPFYAREIVPHNIHELRNHWRHMVAVGREIQRARIALDNGADHHVVCPPNPNRDSSWDDPFYRVSVMLDDGSDAEGALEELYEIRNPLVRYEGAVAL